LLQVSIILLIFVGIDANNPRILVCWKTYLELHCIFDSGKVDNTMLINFWKKFFDQNLTGYVHEKDYLQTLEELIRGTALSHPNKATKNFALMY
jgi:hypothetical protein